MKYAITKINTIESSSGPCQEDSGDPASIDEISIICYQILTKLALNPIRKKVISFLNYSIYYWLGFKKKNKSKEKQLISELDLRCVLWGWGNRPRRIQ